MAGGPSLESIFPPQRDDSGASKPSRTPTAAAVIPARRPSHTTPSLGGNGSLSLYYRPNGVAEALGWLGGDGIYHAGLNLHTRREGSAVMATTLVPYPSLVVDTDGAPDRDGTGQPTTGTPAPAGGSPAPAPIALSLSEFHMLLLYPDAIHAVSRLSFKPGRSRGHFRTCDGVRDL